MSDFDVYGDEMPSVPPLDESAVEALLAGRTNVAATGDMGLTAFVDDLRTAADGPVPQPTPQLAAFMAEGLSTEKGELPATAATKVTGPASQAAGRSMWRTRRMTVAELLAALGAKLAGMGMAAKAALGLGLAAATTTAAGAAGVLPDPAQHAVASVVNTISPLDIPDGDSTAGVAAEGDEDDPATTTTSSPTTSVPGGEDDDGTDGGETGVAANHGGCVSEAAHSANRGPGGEHGKAVSEVAKSDCGKSGGDDDGDDDETTTTSSPTTTAPGGDDDAEVSANRGPGNGNGGNRGNSGSSGSGGSGSGGGNSGSGKGNGN